MPQELTPEQVKLSTLSAKNQMAFQERMSNTAHVREVNDLKAAGLNPILSAHGQGASTPSGTEGDYDTDQLEKLLGHVVQATKNNAQAAANFSDAMMYYGSNGKKGKPNDTLNATKDIAAIIGDILKYKGNGDINWTGTVKALLSAYGSGELDSIPDALQAIVSGTKSGSFTSDDLNRLGIRSESLNNKGKSFSLDQIKKIISNTNKGADFLFGSGTSALIMPAIKKFDWLINAIDKVIEYNRSKYSYDSGSSGGYSPGFSGHISVNSSKTYSNSHKGK